MTCSLFHPGLLLIFSGLLIPFIHGFKRTLFILIIPCLSLLSVWSMPFGSDCSIQYLDYELILINLDFVKPTFYYRICYYCFYSRTFLLQAGELNGTICRICLCWWRYVSGVGGRFDKPFYILGVDGIGINTGDMVCTE